MELNERELATVLHALRVLQDGIIDECAACDHFGDVDELTNEEIDSLCERLNLGDGGQGWELAKDEHVPTLEGVLEYLERQNDLAFLDYRRATKPGYFRYESVRATMEEVLYAAWQSASEALQLAKEAAKPQPIAVHTIAAHP